MNRKKIQEKHLLEILVDIESKKISIELDEKASQEAIEHKNGIYFFKTSTKWTIGVRVDRGKFNYIDTFQHGRTEIDSIQLTLDYPGVADYSEKYKDKDLSEKVWGIKPKIFAGI